MRTRVRVETGDTLLEVIIAVVIMGIIVGAFFSAIATTATASTAHRNLVTADAVLRDYAESTENAVADTTSGCGVANPTTFTVSYTPPTGFLVTSTPSLTNQACPSPTSVQLEHLVVTMPNGHTKSLDIEVRTP